MPLFLGDITVKAHEAKPDPHPQYVKKAGDTMLGALIIANIATALSTADYPFQTESGVADSATAVGYIRDTSNLLDTSGAIVDSLRSGGTGLVDVSYVAGGGLFGSPAILYDYDHGGLGRIVKFKAGGVLGSFSFTDFSGQKGIGVFPSANAFASPDAGTGLSPASIGFGYGNGANYWAFFRKDATWTSLRPDGGFAGLALTLGDNSSGGNAVGKFKGLYLQDSAPVYFGNSLDGSIKDDGTDMLYDSGTGEHKFNGVTDTTGRKVALRSVTGDATTTESDERILFSLTATALCTLQDPTTNSRQELILMNKYSSIASVIFSRTINGDSSFTLNAGEEITILSDGTEWLL